MNGQTYKDLGFDSFMTRTIPSSQRLSSLGARNLIPIGGISPSRLTSPLNATTDIVFSSTDADTAAWTTGTIYFADGTNSGTIDAGNTGDISATTYVYYDREVLGSLQTTTTAANAAKFNRLLVAIVEEGASGKDCKITPTIAAGLNVSGITADQIAANTIVVGNIDSTVSNRLFTDSDTKTNVEGWKSSSDVTKIDGGDIYTGSVTADQIAANTITASEIATGAIDTDELAADAVTAAKIDVSQLDAVAVNTGTLTVDEYVSVGDTSVKIDGANKRIIVNDGSDDRILIGYQSGGF